MNHFKYRGNKLFFENVSLEEVADTFGTPCYVYSRAAIEENFNAFDEAFGDYPHKICYAVKANSNLAILEVLKRIGSGYDIVSGGELDRVLACGGSASNVVFSGVGKSKLEIENAIKAGVRTICIESEQELDRVNSIAISLGLVASVAFRINPDVDAGTHPYIATGLRENKFGIPTEDALNLFRKAQQMNGVVVNGIGCHIGSQIHQMEPFCDAVERILDLVDRLKDMNIPLRDLDLGGGVGIQYENEQTIKPDHYVNQILTILKRRNCSLTVTLEPGRAIVGNAGILLTKVEYLKSSSSKNFVIVDAAMNDLLRPALYDAWHRVIEVCVNKNDNLRNCDVVGPVCETGDFIAKDRKLRVNQGDVLAIQSAGAYGFSMSSNYNTRPRSPEVMVDESSVHLIRDRETISSLFSNEHGLP